MKYNARHIPVHYKMILNYIKRRFVKVFMFVKHAINRKPYSSPFKCILPYKIILDAIAYS